MILTEIKISLEIDICKSRLIKTVNNTVNDRRNHLNMTLI